MTNIPKLKFPDVIDSTILSSYRECPRKFFYSHILGITRSAHRSIHLHFGGCFAAGLETFRKSFYGEGKNAEDAELDAARRIISEWGDYPPDGDGTAKTLENCILGLSAYLREHPPHTDPIQPHFTSSGDPMVEFSFALPTEIESPSGSPILYAGRFDLLGRFNNSLYAVDEKTTSQLGSSWQRQWNLRGQFIGYTKAAQEHGIPVVGAIVRGISVLKTKFGFAEAIIQIPQYRVDEWWAGVQEDLICMASGFDAGEGDPDRTASLFPKCFGSACASYSGCQFEMLCSSRDPWKWVEVEFTPHRWNPLEHSA